MLGKERIKYLASLRLKKKRRNENKFIIEGIRAVEEGLKSNYICEEVFISKNAENIEEIISLAKSRNVKLTEITYLQIKKITDTKHPQNVVALFRMKKSTVRKSNFILAIDNISDPGNLGAIIRTADWFGVNDILISSNSVEIFNPKTLRSTMGSIFHINYEYVRLREKLIELKNIGYEIFLADLNGIDISTLEKNSRKFVLVLSNEAFGPSEDIKEIASLSLTIPKVGKAESLNVGIAGGILIYELKKKSN